MSAKRAAPLMFLLLSSDPDRSAAPVGFLEVTAMWNRLTENGYRYVPPVGTGEVHRLEEHWTDLPHRYELPETESWRHLHETFARIEGRMVGPWSFATIANDTHPNPNDRIIMAFASPEDAVLAKLLE